MKVILAPDSFKHCLRSGEICRYLAEGLAGADVLAMPLADGGEGTLEAAAAARPGGERISVTVAGPFGSPVKAAFFLDDGGAVIESAAACGLELIRPEERNPRLATTLGVGELIAHAAQHHARRCMIGLGGSATVDGGYGMLAALGVKFLDASGRALPPAGALERIAGCDPAGLRQDLPELDAAADVENPLCGPEGAAPVFGPQKGADPAMVRELSAALERYQKIVSEAFGKPLSAPGDGAAGGLGFALRMLGAKRESGAELMLQWSGFDRKIRGASLVITGEGRSDAQTLQGKLPYIVAQHAKKAKIPVVLVSGAVAQDSFEVLQKEFAAVISLCHEPEDLPAALASAPENLRRIGRNLYQLWKAAEQ